MQELTGWVNSFGKAFAAGISIGLPFFLLTIRLTDASGTAVSAWKIFWNIFGASNQLLAALALLGVSVWLFKTASRKWAWIVTFIPAIWMFVMSNWALLILIRNNWFKNNEFILTANPIPIISLILFLLSVVLGFEMVGAIAKNWKEHLQMKSQKSV
jgi:carbon starvation protein